MKSLPWYEEESFILPKKNCCDSIGLSVYSEDSHRWVLLCSKFNKKYNYVEYFMVYMLDHIFGCQVLPFFLTFKPSYIFYHMS